MSGAVVMMGIERTPIAFGRTIDETKRDDTRVVAGGFPLEVFDALGVPRLAPRSDALAETAKTVHFYVGFALIGLIVLHVGTALFHGLVKRDGVFSSMATGRPR